MKKVLILVMLFISTLSAHAYPFDTKYYNHWKTVYHQHSESSYQHAYCSAHNGIEEYELQDKTRVDCLTDTHAIEFDFCNKAYEAVGQSLHYALMTGKKPKIVLILDGKYKQEQMVYVERIKRIGEAYGIDVDYISDEVLELDNRKHCQFIDCKCNKNKHKLWNFHDNIKKKE